MAVFARPLQTRTAPPIIGESLDPSLGNGMLIGSLNAYNSSLTTFNAGEIYGIRIPTLFDENNAIRCAGCGEVIKGTPFRVSLLDIVSPEVPGGVYRLAARLGVRLVRDGAGVHHAYVRERGSAGDRMPARLGLLALEFQADPALDHLRLALVEVLG